MKIESIKTTAIIEVEVHEVELIVASLEKVRCGDFDKLTEKFNELYLQMTGKNYFEK